MSASVNEWRIRASLFFLAKLMSPDEACLYCPYHNKENTLCDFPKRFREKRTHLDTEPCILANEFINELSYGFSLKQFIPPDK